MLRPDGPGRQRIAKLTPLADVIAMIREVVRPVAPVPAETMETGVLAEDQIAARNSPEEPTAGLDGYAVRADDTYGASPYTPVPMPGPVQWCEAGMSMPKGYDALLPLEASVLDGRILHATEAVGPGNGVIGTGELSRHGVVLAAAGTRFTPLSLGRPRHDLPVRVVRPLLVVPPYAAEGVTQGWVGAYLARIGAADGASTLVHLYDAIDLDASANLIVTIGGTGPGGGDTAILDIATFGAVHVHGVAIDPGPTVALGTVRGKPVLALPGDPISAIGASLLLLPPLVRAMAGEAVQVEPRFRGRLTRKVAGGAGRSRVVFALADETSITPLGGAHIAPRTFDRANAYLVVPPESEGYQDGEEVAALPLPR